MCWQHSFKAFMFALATVPAAGAPAQTRPAPDPILSGAVTGPCDPHPDSPTYVGGTDVYGNPVVPAGPGGDDNGFAADALRNGELRHDVRPQDPDLLRLTVPSGELATLVTPPPPACR